MSNISAQPLDERVCFDPRLNELAAADPVSADRLRRGLEAASGSIPPLFDSLASQVTEWGDSKPDIILLLGSPSARDLAYVFQTFPDPCQFLLMEYRLERAAHLFSHYPFEKEVCDGRLVLALGQDEKEIEARFLPLVDFRSAPRISLLECDAEDAEANAFYHRALQQAKKAVRLNVFNIGTLVYRGPLWQHNTIKNLPELIRQPGVEALRGAFAGQPAVVVGAGPSLNDALPRLAQLQDRFVIISTGTALRPLLTAGIRPDLVMSVDGSRKTAPQFETDCSHLFLACSSLVFPPVIDKFKGIFSASMTANPISEWLNRQGPPKGSLIAAGTVTTTAMDLAVHMGCQPVLVLGADLSFQADGTTHASHSMYHGSKLDPDKLIQVPGNYTPTVLTTAQFKCYIDLMEDYISTHPEIRFLNCTTGGARIQGMDVLTPGRMRDFAGAPLRAYDRICELHRQHQPEIPSELLETLRQALNDMEVIQSLAHNAAMICNQLIMILRAPRHGDREIAQEHLRQLETIDRELTTGRSGSIFLDMSLWPIGYQTSAPREQHEQLYSEGVLANRRSRNLYEQIAGAAKWTRELLAGMLPRVETATQCRARIAADFELSALAPFNNKETPTERKDHHDNLQ